MFWDVRYSATSRLHARGDKIPRIRFEVNLDVISTRLQFRSFVLTEFLPLARWLLRVTPPRERWRRNGWESSQRPRSLGYAYVMPENFSIIHR